MSEDYTDQATNEKIGHFVKALQPVALSTAAGIGLSAAIGRKDEEWTFGRVSQVFTGTILLASLLTPELFKLFTKHNQQGQGHGIG